MTISAAGCQTENTRPIRGRGGHRLLAMKDDQPTPRAAVEAVLDRACEAEFEGVGHAGANLGLVRRVAVALTRRVPRRASGATNRSIAG